MGGSGAWGSVNGGSGLADNGGSAARESCNGGGARENGSGEGRGSRSVGGGVRRGGAGANCSGLTRWSTMAARCRMVASCFGEEGVDQREILLRGVY